MKVVVVGATGTLGRAVVNALDERHDVVSVSRSSEPRVDLEDPNTIRALFEQVDGVDAVVCCAASAPLSPLSELDGDGLVAVLTPKLLGQIRLAAEAIRHLGASGSVTLTSGKIPERTVGAAPGALVNAGLEAFVRAAADDLGEGVRLNAVSPGWIAETLAELGLDAGDGIPATDVAQAYVEAVEGSLRGQVLRPGA